MRKVTILQYRLFHYRLELFERLRVLCSQKGIELNVVYGQAFGKEKLKNDVGDLQWGRRVENRYFPVKEKKDLCWQPMPEDLKDSELVVFMQENRLLSNYYWMLKRCVGGPKVAYWGHGRDFQSNAVGGVRERWKRFFINQVDWWFAYTQMTVEHISEAGFPKDRITCLNNAIDTAGLRRDVEGASEAMVGQIASDFDIRPGAPVGLFCGSLYPDKRLGLLVDSSDIIHDRFPDFRLIVIGDGQSAPFIKEAAMSRPWMQWVGVKRGAEKAAYFKVASFVMNPGAVGLHVLDAFAASLPMISTRDAKHGPEVAYLVHDENGLLTENDPEAYADAIASMILDRDFYLRLATNARLRGDDYTVDAMARNFADGIERCIAKQ